MSRMDEADRMDTESGDPGMSPEADDPLGPPQARQVAPNTDVRVNLGQSFIPRDPTFERVMLADWMIIRQKFQRFGYMHTGGYGEEGLRAYRHMRNVCKEYMMAVGSQVARDTWPGIQEEIIAWWQDLDAEADREWHIPKAMGKIGNIMFTVGLGLLRKPQPVKWDIPRSQTNAEWYGRLKKDRARKLSEAVAAR
jgi:hypothetical protein